MIHSGILTFLIIFVTSEARVTPNTEAKMPAACKDKTYCHVKSPDYPQELIDNVISQLDTQIINNVDILDEREGNASISDCESDSKFSPIYEIIDTEGNVRYVVQSTNKRFSQIIKTEACVNPGPVKYSRIFEDYQMSTFNVNCYEKRIKYLFRVLSLDGSSFETVEIKDGLPVCCACQVFRKDDDQFNYTD